MLFLACNSFFSAAKSSGELQTASSFLIVLSPMTGRSQSHSFLLFLSGEKWRFDLLRGEWNNLIECVLLFASCSLTSVALKYRKSRPSGLWYRQQFLSICCLQQQQQQQVFLFTHKCIIFKNAVIDFKWVLTT